MGRFVCSQVTAEIRVGTCSWADEALTKAFYPQGLPAAERLAWYAEHFDTVEVDSTYYRCRSTTWCAAGPSGRPTAS